MNINAFFTFVALVFASIYIFYQPVEIADQSQREIARLDLRDFTLYEMNTTGVSRMMYGEKGRGYSDRYEIEQVALNDKTGPFERKMRAKFGRSSEHRIDLIGQVVVERSDGSQIYADTLTYDKDHKVVSSDRQFFIDYQGHRFEGRDLYYDVEHGRVRANHITAHYQFPEKGAL